MSFDWSSLIIGVVSSGILTTVVAFILNKREREKKITSSEVDDAAKIREIYSAFQKDSEAYWKNRFEDQEKDCHADKERLRQSLAETLVEVATLKEKLAEKNGYIQGLTDPLLKLEAKQRNELRQGRRETDASKGL